MPWFKIDDQSTFNPKVMRAGNAAFGAWVRMGAYCNAQLTDGFIPEQMARMIATARELDSMTAAGIAHKVDGGYRIHDYLEYQPSKEEVTSEREAIRTRVKRHRNGKRNGVTPTVTNADVTATETGPRPVPSRPDQIPPNPPAEEIAPAETVPSWFTSSWCARAKIMFVGPGALVAVWEKVSQYAALSCRSEQEITPELFDAYERVTSDWQGKHPWHPHLFVKHFDAVQSESAGKTSPPKRRSL